MIMKNALYLLLILLSCRGNSQVELESLSPTQWQQDVDYLVNKVNRNFAGFNPSLKTSFNEDAAKIKAAIPRLSTHERILELARLMATLQDGHTEINLTGSETAFSRLPIILSFFGNDLYVVASDNARANIIGQRLTKINDTDITDVLAKLKPYINRDNEIEYIATAPTFIAIPELLEVIRVASAKNTISLTLSDKSGNENTLNVNAISYKEYNSINWARAFKSAPPYLENQDKGYWYAYLPEVKTLYVNFITLYNQNGNISIKKFNQEILKQLDHQKPDKVVIDFRLCRGGNYKNILPLIDELKKRPGINATGKLFIINGRLTFSAAAVATLYFRYKTNATVVGEISRARPNWAENVESYRLPNSNLRFDCLEETKVHFPEAGGSDKIPVDVETPRTYEAYQAGRDEVMEYILSR
jgi:hypothetical protein